MKRIILCLLLIGLPAFGQTVVGNITILGATCAVTNACVTLPLSSNASSATIALTGTWTATVQFEASPDGGTTFVAINGTPPSSTTAVTSATGNGVWTFNVGSMTHLRARASALASGTVGVNINASPAPIMAAAGAAGGSTAFSAITAGTNADTGAFSTAGTWTFSGAGAASVSPLLMSGANFVGTGTTSTPLFYINQGTAPTTWSTSTGGTLFGLNAVTGFAGNFIDFHINGGASLLSVGSAGNVAASSTISTGSGAAFNWSTRSRLLSPADGIITLTPNAGNNNAFTRLQFGGTTTSFPGLCVSGTTLNVCFADGTTGGALQVQGVAVATATSAYLTSAYTNATTTASNITDGSHNMAFSVLASTNYTLKCDFIYQGSATTAGLELKVTGPASPTAINITYDNWTSPTLPHNDSQVAFAGTLGTTSAIVATTNLGAHLWIDLANGVNAGTVQVQGLAAGAGTVTIQPGGSCRMIVN